MSAVVLALLVVTAGEPIAEASPDKSAPAKIASKRASPRLTFVRSLLGRMPKGWVVTQSGLPKGTLGVATGPDGEVFVVSTLDEPLDPNAISPNDARAWLLSRLQVADGTVTVGDAFGAFELAGTLTNPPSAVRAWVIPGKPQWLVSWVGPTKRAGRAEKQVRIAAERWTKR